MILYEPFIYSFVTKSPVSVSVLSRLLIVSFFVLLSNFKKLASFGMIASKNMISYPLGEITSGNYKI